MKSNQNIAYAVENAHRNAKSKNIEELSKSDDIEYADNVEFDAQDYFGFQSETMVSVSKAGRYCDVAVKDLVVGDVVLSASGAQRPICGIRRQIVDCRQHAVPENVLPIRIAAHAFGAGKPRRDLYVSPGQAICIDIIGDVLIPAGLLVNGSSIACVRADCVTFWSLELDRHDILLTENLPIESCPDRSARTGPSRSRLYCPRHEAGQIVDFVRSRLAERAMTLNRSPVKDVTAYAHDVPSSSFAAYDAECDDRASPPRPS
jgi:hypothetical protein